MPSGSELIRTIKTQIREVYPREVHDAVMNGNGRGPLLVDVREQHEFEESHIPGAVHVPRGHLETRIESAIPDRGQRVIAYCSTQNRSALAAVTMKELLGYEDVAVMTGGELLRLAHVDDGDALVDQLVHLGGVDLLDLALDLA